jgi:predicted O-methyltransferase YrrM
MNPVLSTILATKSVEDATGRKHALHSAIDANEGAFVQTLIKERRIQSVVEIGCAYGVSSLFIGEAIAGTPGNRHVIIDPGQYADWHEIGVANMKRAGFKFELIAQPSELALPALLAAGETFDFGFIDGWHTFDHTLVDFFYMNRLIRPGGLIAIDDTHMSSISQVVDFVRNYPCYRLITAEPPNDEPLIKPLKRLVKGHILRRGSRYPSMVALEKIADDQRPWNWHRRF